MLLAGGVTVALMIAGGLGWYFTQDTQALPPVVPGLGTPSPSPLLAASASPTPSPEASPSVSPTASPSASPSRTPSRAPTTSAPPAPAVLGYSDPSPSDPKDFCWYGKEGSNCYTYPDGPLHARATVTVRTTTDAPITLRLRFVQVYYKGGEFEIVGRGNQQPIIIERAVPAGGTTRTVQFTNIDLSGFWQNDCMDPVYTPKIKLTVTANIPGQASTPVYINDNSSCQIITRGLS